MTLPTMSFETAVLLSIETDARAQPDEVESEDLRGWWGDAFADGATPFGSVVWTVITRGLADRVAATRAAEGTRRALQWLVDSGEIRDLEVDATTTGGRIDVVVSGRRRNGAAFSVSSVA